MIQIARYLGPGGFGVLCFSLAFTRIFGVFTDFGFHFLIVREVSRNVSSSSKYLRNLSGMKIILGVVVLGAISIIINLLDYPSQTVQVVYCIGVSVVIGSFSQMLCSIFHAEQRMEFDSAGKILNGLLLVVGVIAAVKLGFGLIGLALLFVAVSVLVLVYYLIALRIAFKRIFWEWVGAGLVEFDWGFWRGAIKSAAPFGLVVCFVTIFCWIDSVMLSVMKGDDVVGWYNAAYRMVLVLLLIPGSLISAIYPVMSKFHETSRDSLRLAFIKSFKYLTILAIPIGIGITLLAKKLILLLYTQDYANSVVALQVLVWSSVLIFMSQPIGTLLNCINKQITITYITGFCVVLNILLNLILIPRYSLVGASVATVATELFSLIARYIWCVKIGYGLSRRKSYVTLAKILVSSVIMGLLIICFYNLNLLVLVPLAVFLYFIVLYMINGLDEEDINLVKGIIWNRVKTKKT